MAIRAALIFNNHGKPRMTRFYSQLPTSRQQALLQRTFALVHRRSTQGTTSSGREVCNFLDAPELRPLLPPSAATTTMSQEEGEDDIGGRTAEAASIIPSNTSTKTVSKRQRQKHRDDDQLRVIYRHYATLYFIFIVDESESELGILDLIQVFVEALDRSFENVCELDLIFHFDEVHAILDEVVQGGLVLETNINEIAKATLATSNARKASLANSSKASTTATASASSGGAIGNSWTPPVGLGGGIPWDAVANVGDWARNVGSRFGNTSSGYR